jgi:sugar (pentulose or hexulose) kinase
MDAYNNTYIAGRLYEPDSRNKSKYDDYYLIYKSLYPELKNINNSIYEIFRK